MTRKQIMRVHTAVGAEEFDADRLLVQNDEYVFLNGNERSGGQDRRYRDCD